MDTKDNILTPNTKLNHSDLLKLENYLKFENSEINADEVAFDKEIERVLKELEKSLEITT